MAGKWYKGVTHSHTTASDGGLTTGELIALAKKTGLDYLIITDHNKNCEELPEVKGLTVIYGAEMTYHGGHANVWGVRQAVDDFACECYEEWIDKKSEAQRRGALVCMNHPWCVKCPWRWEKDISQFDALEVWNAPMHYDNLVCSAWWREQLKNGHKTPVVGGSDYHRDYFGVTRLLSNPVTFVFAESSSPEDILAAIKAGRTSIACGVKKTMIELISGNAIMGDTVTLTPDAEVTVKVHKLKRKHRLLVFDADGECYSYIAKKTGDFSITLPVTKPGFICAQVEKTLSRFVKWGYNLVISKKIPQQKDLKLPPFIYAQTGAMFFENIPE